MAWTVAAKGTSFSDLSATIQDLELPKGTKMKVVIDLTVPVGGMFNWAVADWIAEKATPDGMIFVDAYGDGSQGIVEMKSDPAFLLAVLAFIKAHWVALVIAGFFLYLIIKLIQVLIEVAVKFPDIWIPIAIGLALLGVYYLTKKKKQLYISKKPVYRVISQ